MKFRKIAYIVCLGLFLLCFGCAKNNGTKQQDGDFFHTVTDDMLNSCDKNPSQEAYWNDDIVLLNQFRDEVCLYGLSTEEKTAMLLYMEGEKVLIEYPFSTFRNFYEERPKLNLYDIDGDGEEEVLISLRTATGSLRQYVFWVCDYKEQWNVYPYDDYLQDIESCIDYTYDEKNNTMTFLDCDGNVLWKGELPEYTNENSYTGTVNFENNMGFDAEKIQMDVVPQIELEESLPFEPIQIICTIGWKDGNYEIKSYEIQDNSVQTQSKTNEP